jgi:phosphate transport system substrate-binding protein
LVIGFSLSTAANAVEVDPHLPAYAPMSVGAAVIKSVGSDTMGELMRNWASAFSKLNPDVKFEIESKGSGAAPAALADGTSQLGPMSRPMRSEEYEPFEKKYGYHPASFPAAVDALAIYVNKDNPIQCLTIKQLDRIFSTGYGPGEGGKISTWGDLGLTGEWASHPITLIGRNVLSGTHDVFVQAVLEHKDFREGLKEQPGSAEVVKAVAEDKYAIGYSGIGFLTDQVRAVPLAVASGYECYDTSPASTYSGNYPLARYLYVYLNKAPDKPLDPPTLEFVKYVLSKDGQIETIKSGFYPITDEIRAKDLKALAISDGSQ